MLESDGMNNASVCMCIHKSYTLTHSLASFQNSTQLFKRNKYEYSQTKMEIYPKDDILFFYIPVELEEREEVVDLLRSSYNLCVRQESYNGGWILVIIQPPGCDKEECVLQHKSHGMDVELKMGDSVWTLVINNLYVFSKDASELDPEFAYRLKETSYKFRKHTVSTEFVVYEPQKKKKKANSCQTENSIQVANDARRLSLEREKKRLEVANEKLQEELRDTSRALKFSKDKCKNIIEKFNKKAKSGKTKHSLVVAEKNGLQRQNKLLKQDLSRVSTEAERLKEEIACLKRDNSSLANKMEQISIAREMEHTLEQKLKRVTEKLETEQGKSQEKTVLMENMSKNLKIKQKENNILKAVYQKTKESYHNTKENMKKLEESLENAHIMAVISMLYWEVARNVFEDTLDCENFTPICNKISKSILSSCDMISEDGITFSTEVIMQIRMYGFYLARSHISTDIEKSRSLFEQLTMHNKQFYFIVPEKQPVKLNGKGKKKEEVPIKHYIVNGDLPGHFTTTEMRLGVVDHFTLRDTQEFLNKQAQIPPYTPMVWFIGKFVDEKFEFVNQLEPKLKLLDVKHKLMDGQEIYYSSLFMELAEEKSKHQEIKPE